MVSALRGQTNSRTIWCRFIIAICLTAMLLIGRAALAQQAATHPPIPIHFELKEPGFVTLVIEDSQGRRVRNLISETPFTAGPQTVWWDGMDESGIVPDQVSRSLYQVRGKLVDAGEYHVRGLFRKDLRLSYEFSIYTAGNPPWRTEDRTGGWLADHTPASDVVALPKGSAYGKVPQMLLGSSVAEDGCSLSWVDLTARKLYSRGVGHAYALAYDPGAGARADIDAYCAFFADGIQVVGLQGEGETLPLLRYSERPYDQVRGAAMGEGAIGAGLAIAVYNHVVAVSLPERNEVLFVDTGATSHSAHKPVGKLLATASVPHPRGLMVDASGRLYVLSRKSLLRFDLNWKAPALKNGVTLVAQGLDDPRRLAMDEHGNLYISDWGQSHQVKVFTPDGKFLRAIGKPGGPQLGLYDDHRMSNPQGIAISPDGYLWVAEYTASPKRVSVWSLDGQMARVLYGPSPYGGAGTIDPWDKSRLFLGFPGCMEFRLDWDKGQGDLHSICFRRDTTDFALRDKSDHTERPERPIHLDGRVYLTNVYSASASGVEPIAGIWQLKADKATLMAAAGDLIVGDDFAKFFRDNAAALNKRMPAGVTLGLSDPDVHGENKHHGIDFLAQSDGKTKHIQVLQFWSDLNGDGRPQVEEFTFLKHDTRGYSPSITVDSHLALLTASGVRLEPSGFTAAGAPIYDAAKAQRLTKDFIPTTTMGRQAFLGKDGFLVVTGGPMEGFKDGQRLWYYHSQWNGNVKGKSPMPSYPGELLNTLRILGPTISSPDSEIWAISGDYGQIFLLTTDGLFVGSLFRDNRTLESSYWPVPAQRGMSLNNVSLREECYHCTLTQTTDGKVYLQAGKNMTTLIRLDGLDSVHRFDVGPVAITPQMLVEAKEYQTALHAAPSGSPAAAAATPLKVAIADHAPVVDGNLDEWKDADWVKIDNRSQAALRVSGDKLYVAYHFEYDYRLENSPDSLDNLFKGGPALDLMIGADPAAEAARRTPVTGDIRLLVTRVKNQTKAAIFRAVVPGTRDPVVYDSPIGTATIDQVEDVSAQVDLAGVRRSEKGEKMRRGVPIPVKYSDFEFSIPLSVLGLSVHDGLAIRGDVGLLVGQPGATADRLYWHNKSASMTSDLPTEARLAPALWGQWTFSRPPAIQPSPRQGQPKAQ